MIDSQSYNLTTLANVPLKLFVIFVFPSVFSRSNVCFVSVDGSCCYDSGYFSSETIFDFAAYHQLDIGSIISFFFSLAFLYRARVLWHQKKNR